MIEENIELAEEDLLEEWEDIRIETVYGRCLKLISEVVLRAIRDAIYYGSKQDLLLYQRQAMLWINDTVNDVPFSLKWCCNALSISPITVQRRVYEILDLDCRDRMKALKGLDKLVKE